MHYYEHHIGDYQKKTAHLSLTEHGAYCLMMQLFYATEKPLPTGKALYRLLRAESKADRAAVDVVVREFWTEGEGGLTNKRATAEVAGYREFIEKQRAAGKASASRRGNGGSTGVEPDPPPDPPPNGNGGSTSAQPALQPNSNHRSTSVTTVVQPALQPPIPTPDQNPDPDLVFKSHTHSEVSSSVRAQTAEETAEKGSVCGTFTKIGGEPKPPSGPAKPIPSTAEVMEELRREHRRAGK
jgi:uncharacterized protein YdaU (DUF1376 family)